MPQMTPDPSFYPSPRMAMDAPPRNIRLRRAPRSHQKEARCDRCGRRRSGVGQLRADRRAGGHADMPATSCIISAGTRAARACARIRPIRTWSGAILVVPGLRSSRIHIIDTKPDPRAPKIVKVIEPETVAKTHRLQPAAHVALRSGRHLHECAGRARAATARAASSCSIPKPSTSAARWEADRGPQYLAYDFWWHLGHDTMITSEWGTPNMVENGVQPDFCSAGKYGHAAARLGSADAQAQADARPRRGAADGARAAAGAQSDEDLRLRRRRHLAQGSLGVSLGVAPGRVERQQPMGGDKRSSRFPPSPRTSADLPPLLQGFGAVPPLVTDINLSLDDKWLYVSCWGTGELRQYDVSDPFNPQPGRVCPHRRHRPPQRAPGPAGKAAERRAADGRGQPRRQARLPHQLALRVVGRAVLSRTASTAGW